MCPRTFVSPCTQSLPRPSLNTGSSAEVCGRPGVGPERLHTLGVGASCLTPHPPHPCPPWASRSLAPGHRLGAMHDDGQAVGKVPCR